MRLALLLFSVSLCWAQYDALRTNNGGSVVYFTTRLVQSGTEQPEWGKAFRIDADGLAVEEIRERKEQGAPFVVTNYFDIQFHEAAGGRKATVARRDCQMIGCASFVNTNTSVDGREYPGPAALSPNGRYLVNTGSGIPRPSAALRQWDLTNGEEWMLQWDPLDNLPGGHRVVADNGLVVGHSIRSGDVVLFRRGVAERLTFGSESTSEATIDAEGRGVFFTSRWPEPYDAWTRIRRVDLATRRLDTVIEGGLNFNAPSVSDDGSLVLAVGGDQLWLVRADGRDARQITWEQDGVRTAVLSGDGRVACALTFGGRIVRVDTAAGTVAELLGRTPWLRPDQSALVPGSANEVYGSGLRDDLLAVTVNTRIVPLLDRAPARVIFQLPGDYPAGSDVKVRLVIPSEAPFFGSLNYVTGVVGSRPSVFGNPIHQNWDRIVWQDDPARPGQFVHLYAIGLPTLTRLPICYYGDRIPGPTLDVWYAGPAPGFPGFWQLDLRLPDADANPLPVHCVFEDNSDIQLHVRIPFRP